MKLLVNISRILVGALFIVSGLIKANDPLGFSYKLEEYFQVFAADLTPEQEIVEVQFSLDGNEQIQFKYQITENRPEFEFALEAEKIFPQHDDSLLQALAGTAQGDSLDSVAHIPSGLLVAFKWNGATKEEAETDYSEELDIYMKGMIGKEELFSKTLSISDKKKDKVEAQVDVQSYIKEPSFLVGFMNWLEDMAFLQALLISVIEVVLGIMLLMGARGKLTAWLLFLMIIGFTFLTFYSAYFNKVTDCGCFGDALKITPWQSFYKDVALLFFVFILFIGKKHITLTTSKEDKIMLPIAVVLLAAFSLGVIGWVFPVIFAILLLLISVGIKIFNMNSKMKQWAIAGLSFIITLGFSLFCFWHLPIKDFRPYKIGADIWEDSRTCDEIGKPCPEFGVIYSFKNKNSGEIIKMNDREYLQKKFWENKDYEMLSGEEYTEEIKYSEGYEPPIHDFMIGNDDGEDLTEEILKEDNYRLMVVAYDLDMSDIEGFKKIKAIGEAAEKENIPTMILTASGYEKIENLKHDVGLPFAFYNTDATALKTIVRSNPGLVLIKKGVVYGKWHHNDFPSFEELKANHFE